jgi:hypothetical protein
VKRETPGVRGSNPRGPATFFERILIYDAPKTATQAVRLASKKQVLLADRGVRRWYSNLARGSQLTADVRLRRLSRFCEANKLTPKSLIQLGRRNRRKLEDLLEDYVTKLEADRKAPGYITGIIKAVKSWLNHNDVEVKRKLKVSNSDSTPTLKDERVPEKEELKVIFINSTPRAATITALMAQAGLRPETLGNEDGSDGLTVRDLPELKIENGKARFTRTPTIIKVRGEIGLSKGGHAYFTFLPQEGCEYLAAYLNRRLAAGEQLTSNSPVIRVKEGFEGKHTGRSQGSLFVGSKNVSREVRRAMRPQFKWRPYVLRAYFATQLLEAENHGKLSHPYRVFFMGHKGDIEARYTTNKGMLPEHLVEDMRLSFKNAEPYLTTTVTRAPDKKEMLLEMWRDQARLYGIDPMKVKIEKQRALRRELTLDEESECLMHEIRKHTAQRPADPKLIREDDLANHLAEGWEFVTTLPSGRILVRK